MTPFRKGEVSAESDCDGPDSIASASVSLQSAIGFDDERHFENLHGIRTERSQGSDLDNLEFGLISEGQESVVERSHNLGLSQVPRGPRLAKESMDQLLLTAFVGTRKRLQIDMPWEQRSAKRIFSKDSLVPRPLQGLHSSWIDLPATGSDAQPSDDSTVLKEADKAEGPYFERALMAITDKSFHEQKMELVNDVVDKWLSILRFNPSASDTGRLLLEDSMSETAKSDVRRTIEATLGVRSKSTSKSRANAFLRFIRWRETACEKSDSTPVSEADVWSYFCFLQDSGAAPTRAQCFLSACNYMRHVLGYDSLQAVCDSRRLKGMADVQFSAKAPLRQSRVLTVDQVLWMHCMLDSDSTHPVDTCIFAYLLMALYGRCRHSDLANVEKIYEDWGDDGGFVEIHTRTHKTARCAVSKTILLPIVLPVIGVHGKVWAGQAKNAFEAVGLKFSGTIDGPLYRPPSNQAGMDNCTRGITSLEVTKFLRACFEVGEVDTASSRVSSHSLKATTLSWVGKACIGPADQAILGRHSSAFTETSAIYSRDNAIRAVSRLQEVILAVHDRSFLPDCERSRYFPKQMPDAEASAQDTATKVDDSDWSLVGKSEAPTHAGVVDLEAEVVDSPSEDDLESEDSSESDSSELRTPKCFTHHLQPRTAVYFVKHRTSKLVHLKDGEFGNFSKTLSCGRTLNGNYEDAQRFDTVDMCKRCRINAQKDGILPSQ